ncbi:tetratricopeptide repeat protein [Streptococcus sp. SPS1]|uniref:tetratricopeptide repeat protein n=1 Tax=Streptococcus sp. SPS1 TaxID=3018247 RepID=UPI0021B73A1F|nr:tetratricopeptide repeat protein [Streptococcus sp. SPS1]MDN5027009.1 tetratricopeptide repeat protein [Streptococcus sp. SPS1]
MFGFFKKKEPKQAKKPVEEVLLSEEERAKLLEKVEEEKSKLTSLTENKDLAEAYERLGLLYGELGEVNQAIETLEKSLEAQLSMGDGYKKLMALYNAKRAEAAKNRDSEGIDYYMSKMDDMRNIAKKVTLSR